MTSTNKTAEVTYSALEGNHCDTKFGADGSTVVVDAVAVASPSQQRVEVEAPTDLVGGYELHVDLNGRPAVVRVPDGGARKGEKFIGTVVSVPPDYGANCSGSGHNIPTGRWRDGICNFFAHGVCHPLCCLAYWCSPLALGQVMTRMKLNGAANQVLPGREGSWWSAFKVMALVFVIYFSLDQAFSTVIDPYFQYDVDEDGNYTYDYSVVPTWILVILGLRGFIRAVFFFYILYAMIRTRAAIRERYAIPEQSCIGCEDCCCAFWLPCCTITQMARHTADYQTYGATCCTDTGLSPHAPEIV